MTTALSVLLSLSLMLGTGNGSPFVRTEATAPNNIVQTPYGTATKSYTADTNGNSVINIGPITVPVSSPTSILKYTFSGVASGTFDIVIAPTLTNYYLYTRNCVLISVLQNGNMRFRVTNVEDCEIVISHNGVYQQVIYSFENQNITIDDTLYSNVDDIMTYTQSIDGNVQTMKANTTTIKNVILQSLGGYVTNDGSLYTDMQTLVNTITQLNDIAVSLDVPIYSQGIYQVLSNNDVTKVYHDLYGNYINIDSTNTFTTYLYNGANQIMIYEANATNVYPVFSNSNITTTILRTLRTSGVITYLIGIQNNAGNGTYTFTFNNSSNTRKIYPLYFGFNSTIPYELIYATRGYFRDPYTDKLDDVIDAIGNMAVNVNNMTVNATGITYNTNQTTVENNITNYNDYSTTVNNVETNFGNQFINAKEDYTLDGIQIDSKLIGTSNFMNNVATQLYGIDIVKYPVVLMLLGIVLIGVLG